MRISLFGLVTLALVIASCSSSDLGTGMNTVDRKYTCSVKQAHDASLSTLKDENLKVQTDKWDNLGAELVAERSTDPGNKVLVNVKALDVKTCEISVRVDPGNKAQAEIIQNKIGEKLTPAAK
jgi:hypothetical protein